MVLLIKDLSRNNIKEVLINMSFQRKDAKNAKVAKKTDEQSNRKNFAFFAPWRLRVEFLINQISLN